MTSVYVIGIAKKKKELVGMMEVRAVVYDDRRLLNEIIKVAIGRISPGAQLKYCPDPCGMLARLYKDDCFLYTEEALGDEMVVVERHEVVDLPFR